jgi:hypothetical protein
LMEDLARCRDCSLSIYLLVEFSDEYWRHLLPFDFS